MNFIKSLFLPYHVNKLSGREIGLLNSTLNQISVQSDEIAADFYKNLFCLEPSLHSLFQHDHAIQQKKFMIKLSDIIQSLQQEDQSKSMLKELGKNHLLYGIKEEHYSQVGAALLTTLRSQLRENWNKEMNDAWLAVFTHMVLMMKSANAKAA